LAGSQAEFDRFMSPPGEPRQKLAHLSRSACEARHRKQFIFETCIFNICLITPSESSNQGCQIINVEAVRFVPSRVLKLCLFFGGVWRPCGRVRVLARQRRSGRLGLGQEKSSARPGLGATGLPCCKVCSIKFRASLFAALAGATRVASSPPGQEQGRSTAGPGRNGLRRRGLSSRQSETFAGVPAPSFGPFAGFGARPGCISGSILGCTSSSLRRISGSTKCASLRAPAFVKWTPSPARSRTVWR